MQLDEDDLCLECAGFNPCFNGFMDKCGFYYWEKNVPLMFQPLF